MNKDAQGRRKVERSESNWKCGLKGTETRLREDMKQLSERVARVEHSQAKLEGLLEGLREAITVRASAS